MSPPMTYRGVQYTVVPSTTPGFWNWQFRIDGNVKSGRVETSLELMAMRRVKTRIDRALREASEGAAPASCSKCQSTMLPASVIPGIGELAHKIFKCTKCGHIQIGQDVNSAVAAPSRGR